MGRPSILNDAIIEAYGNALDVGHTVRSACAFCGLDMHSVQDWRQKGDADLEAGNSETLHARFATRYAHARGVRMNRWLGIIDGIATGAEKDSDRRGSAQWLLEHCEPEEFGAKAKVELTGKDGGPVQTQNFVAVVPPRLTAAEFAAQYAAKAADAESKT